VGLRERRAIGAGWAILVRGPYGQSVRTVRPWCVGPAGCLAVLGLIGVWLELALRAQTIASPDPITPALLSHAQGIAQPTPLAQLYLEVVTVGEI